MLVDVLTNLSEVIFFFCGKCIEVFKYNKMFYKNQLHFIFFLLLNYAGEVQRGEGEEFPAA